MTYYYLLWKVLLDDVSAQGGGSSLGGWHGVGQASKLGRGGDSHRCGMEANRLSRQGERSSLVTFNVDSRQSTHPTAWPCGVVVLTRSSLIQTTPHEGDEGGAVPLLLHKQSVVEHSEAAPYAFLVTGQYGRVVLLAAGSDAERDEWVRTIRRQVKLFFFTPQVCSK